MNLSITQARTIQQVRTMGHKFNRIEPTEDGVVLRMNTTLLTGKKIELDVATVYSSGSIQMHEEVQY